MTNRCVYDCKYCVNRRSNETRRAAFTPEELADLTVNFYRRNYIEGLFLSSGVLRSPDYTTELMIRALRLLCQRHTPDNMEGFSRAIAKSLGRTGVWRITVEEITGKAKR